MRSYSDSITLSRNARGCYSLDTTKGCRAGMSNTKNGCYGECYAARSSKKYGYDFSDLVLRKFKDEKHISSIISNINKIDMPFIRIGVSGDPSEAWEHTLNVCKSICGCDKYIVIVTKHWNILTSKQLDEVGKMGICINTSISALDDDYLIATRLEQYNRLKPFCNSVLRIVSCDFNTDNKYGRMLKLRQMKLFENENTIDTVLRVSKKNKYYLDGIINIQNIKFLGMNCYVSMADNNTHFGLCKECKDMCGLRR